MVLALLLGCLSIGLLLAGQVSSPATTRSRRRTAARRARFVAAHPTQVNSTDIVAALCRDGIDADRARLTTDRARTHGIRPFTLWLWLEQHGAAAVSIAVAADVTQRELLTHVSEGTSPDAGELRLFAAANGLDVAALPVHRCSGTATLARTRRRPTPSTLHSAPAHRP